MNRILRFITLILSLLAAVSCGKDGGGQAEEALSIDVHTINAVKELGQYPVKVSANCGWTLDVPSDISWLKADRVSGSGDATVNIRVFANSYASSRTAVLMFSSASGEIQTKLTVAQEASESGKDASSVKVRIGSYNIRVSGLDTDAANVWSNRRSRCWNSIRDNDFDVFGLQEVTSTQQKEIAEEFKNDYDVWFFSPYSQSGKGDKAHGIMFKKSKYTLSDTHFFWMGEDPTKMSASDIGSSGTYNRGGCCAVLTEKATGLKFFMMVSHACLNQEPRDKYASTYEQMEKKYNTENLPSFFVGDLNADPTQSSIKTILSYWRDAYADAASKSGPMLTFNSFSYANGKSRIDFVFYRGSGITVDKFVCNNTLYGGLYASDHFPIYADITIEN